MEYKMFCENRIEKKHPHRYYCFIVLLFMFSLLFFNESSVYAASRCGGCGEIVTWIVTDEYWLSNYAITPTYHQSSFSYCSNCGARGDRRHVNHTFVNGACSVCGYVYVPPTPSPSPTPMPSLTLYVGQQKSYTFPSNALYSGISSKTVANPEICSIVTCTNTAITIKGLSAGTTTVTIVSVTGNQYGTSQKRYSLQVIVQNQYTNIDKPSFANKTYNGTTQSISAGLGYTLSGTTSASNAGTYNATATLSTGYRWSDNSTDPYNFSWTINPKSVAVNWDTGTTLTYNGSTQAPTASCSSGISGQTINLNIPGQVNPGNYTATATILSVTNGSVANYVLTNNTYNYVINKANGTGTVSQAGWIVGNTPPDPVVSSSTNGTNNVTFEYKLSSASSYSSTVPTSAGNYTIRATFAETQYYNAVEATNTFTVGAGNYRVESSQIVYSTLHDALTGCSSTDTITVLLSCTDSSSFVINTGKDITIAKNGKTLTKTTNPITNNGGTLTINGSGTIKNNTSNSLAYVIKNDAGTLNISEGTLTHEGIASGNYYAIYGSGGTINISSGTVRAIIKSGFTTSGLQRAIAITKNCNLNISGGTITATGKDDSIAIYAYGSNNTDKPTGTISISAGTVSAQGNSIYIDGASNITPSVELNLTGSSKVTSTVSNGIYTRGSGTITLNGDSSNYIRAGANGIYNAGSGNITITKGNINQCERAVYITGSGNLVMNAGTLSSTSNTIQFANSASGTLTIKGGTITSETDTGVYVEGSNTVVIGTQGGTPSITSPSIAGNSYGIVATNYSFYDGIFKGVSLPYGSEPVAVQNGYSIMQGEDSGYKTAYLGVPVLLDTTITLSPKNITYNGNYISIDPAVVVGSSSEPTYTYYTNSACTTTTNYTNNGSMGAGTAPKYAGTYYVKAHVDGDANYKEATSSAVTLTINKATPSLKIADKTVTYTGNYVQINPAVVEGVKVGDVPTGTITYTYYTAYTNSTTNTKTSTSATGGAAQSSGGAPKNAKDFYYVVATIATDKNYLSATSKSISNSSLDYAKLKINKAPRNLAMAVSTFIDIGQTKSISYTYDGEDVTTSISGFSNTIASCTNTDGSNGGSISITGNSTGSTTLTLTLPESTNYTASTENLLINVDEGSMSDTQAPIGKITVKNTRNKSGKEYVSNQMVDLEIYAFDAESDVSYMALTNENARSASNLSWIPFAQNVNEYRLSNGDGDKTIFLMLKDSSNNTTVTFVNN